MHWTTHPGGWNHERETMHVLRDDQGRALAHFHFNRYWCSCEMYEAPDRRTEDFYSRWIAAPSASWQAVRKEVEQMYNEKVGAV